MPAYIPSSAHDSIPDFKHITRTISGINLARLRKDALLDEDATSIAVPSAPPPVSSAGSSGSGKLKGVTSSLAQQEKEFQKAVQPGSPISALLSSARQPLLVAPGTARGEQPLLRKLQAAREAKSPGRPTRENRMGGLQGIQEEQDEVGTKQEDQRRKELESQKARIVAQMVPATGSNPGSAFNVEDQENLPPPNVGTKMTRPLDFKGKSTDKPARVSREAEKERIGRGEEVDIMNPTIQAQQQPAAGNGLTLRPNGFDAAAQTLTAAFDALAIGKLFRDPRSDRDLPDPKVFIVSWVDYCNKYGMGYALTDGSVGVHFNDSTTIVLSPDKW